ncbi:MAG: TetR/AcrR family transcriptional regulator [Bacteroidota bacterium]|nr:TetR/AcrR family transcriptional regulator [Bacteroidota bacterium]
MVNITHTGENIERINKIIEVSQKRFGLYGFEKTAMREIASDMGMSKGSLYYYFPDKESLYRAVIEKEQNEFLNIISEKFKQMNDPSAMLLEFINIRIYYFRKFLNLGRFRFEEFMGVRKIMGDIWLDFRKKETILIKEVIESGIQKGIYKITNSDEVAEIFMELLIGLAKSNLHHKDIIYVENEDYESMQEKARIFSQIFINGIANN